MKQVDLILVCTGDTLVPKSGDSGVEETSKSLCCRKCCGANDFSAKVVGADDAVAGVGAYN